jgi:hypothetical protein
VSGNTRNFAGPLERRELDFSIKTQALVEYGTAFYPDGFANGSAALYPCRHMVPVQPCGPAREEQGSPYRSLLPPIRCGQSVGNDPGITREGCIDALQYTTRHVAYKLFQKNMVRTNSITYAFQLPGMKMYMTVDPINIKAILATQFQEFGKGPLFYESWKEVFA